MGAAASDVTTSVRTGPLGIRIARATSATTLAVAAEGGFGPTSPPMSSPGWLPDGEVYAMAAWQAHGHHHPPPVTAREAQPARMEVDDLAAQGQAQPAALRFGGEERQQRALHHLGRHARAAIEHRQHRTAVDRVVDGHLHVG